jgi:hypothetical protein
LISTLSEQATITSSDAHGKQKLIGMTKKASRGTQSKELTHAYKQPGVVSWVFIVVAAPIPHPDANHGSLMRSLT